jgi:hypothetical protein
VQRFRVKTTVVSENAYLQVANELGVVTMGVFVAMLGGIARALWRRPHGGLPGDADRGLASAAAALLVGGMFLHIWLNLPLALMFWALAGLRLASTRPGDQAGVPTHS